MALLLSLTGVSSTLTASGFVPYYDYTGTLAVSGTVGPMTTTSGTQTYFAQLTGVDPLCAAAAGPAANSCGVHFHENPTCTANAGGHYYTGAVTTDPWTNINYATGQAAATPANGGTMVGTYSVNTGATSAQIAGKSLFVHDYDGNRIACGIIGQTDTSACSSWCNEYTCGFGSCSSCYTCQLPPCSSWCAHCIPPPPASSRCSQSIPRHAIVCATTHL